VTADILNRQLRAQSASIRILARKKSPGAKPAEYLTALGMHLVEVRVIGDEKTAIVDAVNALRHRYSYVFTTGGIGPTHDDITADSVAKAFGVPIDNDPRALAILREWLEVTGAEMTEARLRMTRIPKGADLVLNKVSGAPGFWIAT
jgi:molybdopterin-biosynthesis enzyme MoeA-like protein